jgi:N-acetylneuraminate synthase/N,N'-diacetyllegionaminate synthase
VRRFKVGSGDLDNLPLLRRIARLGLPVILSTGMAEDGEIAEALATLAGAGAGPVTLLHCVSRYPTPPEDLQLRRIPRLRERFGRPVGFSDHSLGIDAALAAAALGATVIEKHLTLDRTLPGPDHAASAEPFELAELARKLRALAAMLGDGERRFHPEESALRAVARKSIVARRAIAAGEALSSENLALLRPGTGLAPREWDRVIGRRAAASIPGGEPIQWSHLR